ncbi:MAG: PH domain-containing protein [Propionibacteriaceae bacterium]|nr:PH domain-containing protein [Propionibacteriaceae bacterium]
MARNKDLLARDEQIVLTMRTHIKALLLAIIVLIASTVILGIGLALLPQQARPIGTYVLIGLYAIAFFAWVLLPYLRWFTATYTITNRRIITRKGILNKTGHDLPLRSINNVNYERSLSDRIFGCGTLILVTAAEQPLHLPDVPRVEQVHVVIADLIFDGEPDEEA